MFFWCHRFDQNINEIFLRISALVYKNRVYEGEIEILQLVVQSALIFFIWPLLEASAEILKKNCIGKLKTSKIPFEIKWSLATAFYS